MRTYTFSNTVVTYPEPIVWIYDSNVIKLESNGPVGAEITVTTPTFETKTLSYYSELDQVVFTLDDVILSLYNDNLSPWGVNVTVYENGISVGSLSFVMTVYNGKSFITRCHGMQSTYYVYDPIELRKISVYALKNGMATIGQSGFYCYTGINSYNLQNEIHNEGTYEMRLRGNNQTPPVVAVSGVEADSPNSAIVSFNWQSGYDPSTTYGGDIWYENEIVFPCIKRIIYQSHCNDYNFIELRYIDTDGCIRYLGGKLVEEDDEVKDKAVNTLGINVWSHNPHRWINSSNKSIKVGFMDIEKKAYPQDIMYSDTIWMRTWNGNWEEVRLKSTTFKQTDDDYLDFELEIYTHER